MTKQGILKAARIIAMEKPCFNSSSYMSRPLLEHPISGFLALRRGYLQHKNKKAFKSNAFKT